MYSQAPHCHYQGLLSADAQRKLCEHCRVNDLSICGAFALDHAEELAGVTQQVNCKAKSTVFMEGDGAEYFYTVTSGVMQFSKYLASGRRQILGFLFAGDFLGLALEDRYSYTAEAVTNCELCQFHSGRFEDLMGKYPELEHTLFRAVSNELVEVENRMITLGHQLAEKRLASFLVWYLERAEKSGLTNPVVELPMTRRDIADYLCLSFETVSRAFTKLRGEGFIELDDPHKVRIKDLENLQLLAED